MNFALNVKANNNTCRTARRLGVWNLMSSEKLSILSSSKRDKLCVRDEISARMICLSASNDESWLLILHTAQLARPCVWERATCDVPSWPAQWLTRRLVNPFAELYRLSLSCLMKQFVYTFDSIICCFLSLSLFRPQTSFHPQLCCFLISSRPSNVAEKLGNWLKRLS